MALKDRTGFQYSQPLLYAAVRPSGNSVLARFHTLHIDAHITGSKTVLLAATGDMGRVCAGHQRLGRDTSGIHAGATEFVAFHDGDLHARTRKPRRQRRARLARPNDDCVVVIHCGGKRELSRRILATLAAPSGVFPSWLRDDGGGALPGPIVLGSGWLVFTMVFLQSLTISDCRSSTLRF